MPLLVADVTSQWTRINKKKVLLREDSSEYDLQTVQEGDVSSSAAPNTGSESDATEHDDLSDADDLSVFRRMGDPPPPPAAAAAAEKSPDEHSRDRRRDKEKKEKGKEKKEKEKKEKRHSRRRSSTSSSGSASSAAEAAGAPPLPAFPPELSRRTASSSSSTSSFSALPSTSASDSREQEREERERELASLSSEELRVRLSEADHKLRKKRRELKEAARRVEKVEEELSQASQLATDRLLRLGQLRRRLLQLAPVAASDPACALSPDEEELLASLLPPATPSQQQQQPLADAASEAERLRAELQGLRQRLEAEQRARAEAQALAEHLQQQQQQQQQKQSSRASVQIQVTKGLRAGAADGAEVIELKRQLEEQQARIAQLESDLKRAAAAAQAQPAAAVSPEELEKLKRSNAQRLLQIERLETELKALRAEQKQQQNDRGKEKEKRKEKEHRGDGKENEEKTSGGELAAAVASLRSEQALETARRRQEAAAAEAEGARLIEEAVFAAERELRDQQPAQALALAAALLGPQLRAFEPFDGVTLARLLRVLRRLVRRAQVQSSPESAADALAFVLALQHALETRLLPREQWHASAQNGMQVLPEPGASSAVAPAGGEQPLQSRQQFFARLQAVAQEAWTGLVRSGQTLVDRYLIPGLLSQRRALLGASAATAAAAAAAAASGQGGTDTAWLVHEVLGSLLRAVREAALSEPLQRQYMAQIFYYVDARLVNLLLSQRDLCTCSFGLQLKLAISQLEEWAAQAGARRETLSWAREQLEPLREAANLLVVDKAVFEDEHLIGQMFSALNLHQIRHLLEMFTPDPLLPQQIPESVRRYFQKSSFYQVRSPPPARAPLLAALPHRRRRCSPRPCRSMRLFYYLPRGAD